MKTDLIRLLKHTCIYSGGQLFSRLINFCLLPLTTQYLLPEDYGLIGSLAIGTQLLTGIFTLGLGVSLSRCYYTTEEKRRGSVIYSGFFLLFIQSAVLLLGLMIFSSHISYVLTGNENYGYCVVLVFLTLALSAISLPFQTWLRLKEKSVAAVLIASIEVIFSIGATLYLILYMKKGAEGMLTGALIGQIVGFISVTLFVTKHLVFSLNWTHIKDMLHVGYPYIFGSIGFFLLQCSPRYALQYTWGLEEVGLFFMGANFAQVVGLFITGFINAWAPFSLSYMDKLQEAEYLFGKVLRYFLLLASPILMIYFLGARAITTLMLHPNFHEVWSVMGLHAVTQILFGAYGILATAFIFKKKSIWQVGLELTGGLLCACTCMILVPPCAIFGAALSVTFGYSTLVLLTAITIRKLLKIQYDRKIFYIVSILFIMVLLSYVKLTLFLPDLFLSAAIGILASIMLYQFGLTQSEREALYSLIKTRNLKSIEGRP